MEDNQTQIRIGTSGYSYNDWKGIFYPEGCASKNMLSAYAARFDTVELNFSYYRMPEAKQLGRLCTTAGAINPDFTFAIKAHRTLTHEIHPRWQEDASRFVDAVSVMSTERRLAMVLLQFPYSFHYTANNRKHLDQLLKHMAPLPCACEFRSREWLHESVYEGLGKRSAALVAVDEPQLDGLLPPTVRHCSETGYVRFHGRNKENWWRGDNASRYDYLYSDNELREWLPRIDTLATESKTIYIYFNNHWRAQATVNAEQMIEILR